MDFIELAKKRSSVRQFAPQRIKREDIESCLEASRLAPSACNSQPWQFIVVDEPEARAKLCDAMLSGIYGLNSFAREAPCLVAVVTDKSKWFSKVCNVVNDTKLYLIDIGIACEHFVLRAAELGIGTCYLGWFNERAVKRAMGIPATKRAHLVLAMGYPAAGEKPREKIRKTRAEMSSYYEDKNREDKA